MDLTAKTAAELTFRKKIPRDLQTVSLDADMIRLLLVIDEHKSLYQIAAEAEMDSATFKKALRRLLEQGLIETVQKRVPLLGKLFLDTVHLNLSRAIGPMAQIVLEETLAEMNLNPNGIALDQAAELVTHLALEISDEGSRTQFQKAIIPLLNQVKP
jgi:DNA-binding transcriptional regulator YhcF (GntR family)